MKKTSNITLNENFTTLFFLEKKTLLLNRKTVLFEQIANARVDSFDNKKVNFAAKTYKLCFQ
jgi:hypothetical protein